MEEEDLREISDDELEIIYADDVEEIDDFPVESQDVSEKFPFDTSTLTFSKHAAPVFCSALNKDGTIAITGGQDDLAYLWSTSSGEILKECTGHKDSVTAVGFSYDDRFVVTGDMQGLVQVWSVTERRLEWCNEGDAIEWIEWHHLSNVLIAGSGGGDIYLWKIPEGNCKVLPSCGFSCSSGKLLSDGSRLLAGYGNGQVRLWDIKTTTTSWISNKEGREEITSIDISSDSSLFVFAPGAELCKLTTGTPISTLTGSEGGHVEAVAFNHEMNLVATGSLHGTLCVWDYEKNTLRHEAKLPSGITILKWASKGKLIVGLIEGTIYLCDGLAGTLKEVLEGHRADILSLTLFKDNSRLLSTSDDGTAKIFPLKD